MTMIGMLIAAFAAYWVYNDARKRGHDTGAAIMWALGTLAVLVVFLPLYLIFGRRQKTPPPEKPAIDIEAVPVEETISCPMCGKSVNNELKTCPYCGCTLNPTCVNCGRVLNREWRACPYCETPVHPR